MKRQDNVKRMKELMEELRKGKKPVLKKKEEPKLDLDVNDDGKIDDADVELVKKAARKKKVVKKDD